VLPLTLEEALEVAVDAGVVLVEDVKEDAVHFDLRNAGGRWCPRVGHLAVLTVVKFANREIGISRSSPVPCSRTHTLR